MGLFGKRKSRATRRAEARAIKARAKLEAKLSAKNEARRIKAAQRAESKALKAQLKARRDSDRAALKVAEAELKVAREGKLLSPTRIRRLLTVSRLLAPILTPVIYRAAMAARGLIDQRRADQLGVPLAQIGRFSGHGARLSARVGGSRATHRRRQLRSCRPRRPPRKHQQERRRRRRHPPKKHPPRVLSPRHQSLPRRPSVCSSGSKPTASLQLLLRMQRHKQSRQWKAPTTPWRATHQCRRRVTRPCR